MMHRRAFFGLLVAGLAVPTMGALAQQRLEKREERRQEGRLDERCEHLEHEEHELRERLEHEHDRADRARIERRLGELRAERERCRR
jgi:hypothetical protein